MSIVSSSGSYSSTSVGQTTAYGTHQSSVTSVGSAAPAQYQPPVETGTVVPEEPIPTSWMFDQKTGMYYDQNSRSTWVLDPYLKKYYSPSHGWFLISLYYTDPRGAALVAQYYYDITNGVIYDITTGAIVNADQIAGNGMTAPQSGRSQGGWTITNVPQNTAAATPPASTQNTGSQPQNQQVTQSGQPKGGWTISENPQTNSNQQNTAPQKTQQGKSPKNTDESGKKPSQQSTGLSPEEKPWEAAYYMLTNGESACGDLEQDTDRLGNDISALTLMTPDPCECARLCREESTCVAFTYVAPGYEGNPDAQCFLKNAPGEPTPNEHCISGLVSR
ncbi:MAG: hypothetical protein JXA44_07115 [Methanospirillaceae archaeon]|nr:hypothetical protein [Methanospirillaceae archaeon]